MFYIFLILLTVLISLLIYNNRLKLKKEYIKLVIKTRRKKRKALVFENVQQQRYIQMVERLLRDPNSEILITSKSNDYFVWSGDIYAYFNNRIVTVVNGKLDKNVLISDKIYSHLCDKFYTRQELNRQALVNEIERKSGIILDGIVNEFENHIKTKKKPVGKK